MYAEAAAERLQPSHLHNAAMRVFKVLVSEQSERDKRRDEQQIEHESDQSPPKEQSQLTLSRSALGLVSAQSALMMQRAQKAHEDDQGDAWNTYQTQMQDELDAVSSAGKTVSSDMIQKQISKSNSLFGAAVDTALSSKDYDAWMDAADVPNDKTVYCEVRSPVEGIDTSDYLNPTGTSAGDAVDAEVER